ncbi:MAG TPA: TadG family pilus assembly protein [Dongiaceae bacterium]|nr:TadG family pilus assembly protein [Dongiaceae bacterium]
MKDASRNRRRGARLHERGQSLPLLAFAICAILGMVALVVDVGFWRYQQRLEQAAADSAAIAGDIRLYYVAATAAPGSPALPEVVSAAQEAAAQNGFADDGGAGDTVVTVNSPPAVNTPPYPGATPYPANSAVEVIVKHKQPIFFGGIFGQKPQFVTARAVAVKTPDLNDCMFQMDPGKSVHMGPPGTTESIDCNIIVNGSIPNGTIQAPALTYSGPPPGATLVPPLIARKSFPAADPCLTIAGCAYLSRAVFPVNPIDPGSQPNLSPGSYVNCCSSDVSLAPGVYYFYGGISGGSLSGTGVTIVNVDGGVNFSGRGGMNVTAPLDGPTAGVAFYQPPANSNPYRGNGDSGTFAGLFYAPTADYTTTGHGDTFSLIVVGGIGFTGSKTILIDPTISTRALQWVAQPTHAVLAE